MAQVNKQWENSLCQCSALNPGWGEDVWETASPESCDITPEKKNQTMEKGGVARL